MKIVSTNTVIFLLQQIEFYKFRQKITKIAIQQLPDSKDESYTREFRILILQQHIQLTSELIDIVDALFKLEMQLKEALP